jgi:integrase
MIGLEEAARMTDIPNISQKGTRLGNWLTREQAKELLAVPNRSTLKGKRDYVILALLVGCALRRSELAELDVETIQQREGRWVWPTSKAKADASAPSRSRSGQTRDQCLDDRGGNRRWPVAAVGLEERVNRRKALRAGQRLCMGSFGLEQDYNYIPMLPTNLSRGAMCSNT